MAQPLVSNMSLNGVNAADSKDQHNAPCENNEKSGQTPQPNVRHIPIFVEGRDEPLINKNVDHSTTDSPNRPQAPINDMPMPGSIFSRVKDLPVRKNVPELNVNPNVARTSSPSRPIPFNMHSQTQQDNQQSPTPSHQPQGIPQHYTQAAPQHPQQEHHPVPPQPEQKTQQHSPAVQQSIDAITKIQKIQHEVLDLMNKVEKYKGGSRKDREYVYLDEMLTQNLLKLDTIDAEGKDNIKAARKEAINCINKCIAVLEAKTDLSRNAPPPTEDTSNEVTSKPSDPKNDVKTNEKST